MQQRHVRARNHAGAGALAASYIADRGRRGDLRRWAAKTGAAWSSVLDVVELHLHVAEAGRGVGVLVAVEVEQREQAGHVLDQLGPVEPLGGLARRSRLAPCAATCSSRPCSGSRRRSPSCAFSSARSESGSLALSPMGGARRRTRCRAGSSGGWRPSPGRPPSHAGAPGRARRSSSCRWRRPACRLRTSSTRSSSTRSSFAQVPRGAGSPCA
jgi:hypothetical protein